MGRGEGARARGNVDLAAVADRWGLPAPERVPWPADLPPYAAFLAARASGRITIRQQGDLAIFNYTPATQFSNCWGPVEQIARGLIVNLRTGEIVARPFSKFFTLGQRYQLPDGREVVATPPVGCPYTITEKMDGSLAIWHRDPATGAGRIATRGSFIGPQAIAGQRLWNGRYAARASLVPPEATLLMEIIAPETRVVVPYDYRDLVLLAVIDRFTGREWPYGAVADLGGRLGMPVTARIDGSLDDVRATVAAASAAREGVVVAFDLPDGTVYRLKLKGAEYLALHKLLTGATPGAITDTWQTGGLDALIAALPDEFADGLRAAAVELDALAEARRAAVEAQYTEGWATAGGDRRQYAAWVKARAADPAVLPKDLVPILLSRPDLDDRRKRVTLAVVDAVTAGTLTDDPAVAGSEPEIAALLACETAFADLLAAGLAAHPTPVAAADLRPAPQADVVEAAFFGTWYPCPASTQPITAQQLCRRWLGSGAHPDLRALFSEAITQSHPQRYVDEAVRARRATSDDPDAAEQALRAAFASLDPDADNVTFTNWLVGHVPTELRSYAIAWRTSASRAGIRRAARRIVGVAWQKGVLGAQAEQLPAVLRATLTQGDDPPVARADGYLTAIAAALAQAAATTPGIDAPEPVFRAACARLGADGAVPAGNALLAAWCQQNPAGLGRLLEQLRAAALGPVRRLAAAEYRARHAGESALVEDDS